MKVHSQKDYFCFVICSAIICEHYKGNLPILNKVSNKILDVTSDFFKTNRLS